MTVYRHPINRAWIISDIVEGYRVERAYYYCTKAQAMAEFRQEFPYCHRTQQRVNTNRMLST